MRLLYLTHQYFPRHVGGTEVYTHALAKMAQRAGHEAAVVTYHESASGDPRAFGPRPTQHDGIRVWELHYNLKVSPHPAQFEYRNPMTAEWVGRILDEHRPDLVHATHLMKLSGSVLQPCLERSLPVVITLTDFWVICPRHTLLRWNGVTCEGPGHRLDCVRCLHDTHGFAAGAPFQLPDRELIPGLYRTLAGNETAGLARDLRAMAERNAYLASQLATARAVIALSNSQQQVLARNGYAAGAIQVIPHGPAEEELVTEPRRPSRRPRVVFIGALVPPKGAHVLIEALDKARDLDVECRIYGSLKPASEYRTRLREQGRLDKRVRVLGEFAPGKLSRVLAETDILVIPSLWFENAPFVAKSARRLGIPVLASRVGSLEESLPETSARRFFRPGDAGDLATGLRELLQGGSWEDRRPDPSTPTFEEHARQVFEIYAAATGLPW